MWRFNLSNELFKIYLRDESDQAYTHGINAIAKAFKASEGAIFYKNPQGMFKFGITSSGYPVSIPEKQWRDCIPKGPASDGIFHFQHWSLPGTGTPIENWLAIKLQTPNPEPSYIFLGRNNESWTESDATDIVAVAKIVNDIITIRYKRECEVKTRQEAEDALKLIQTRMAAFFETSHDTIYTLDGNECFSSINEAGVKLLGATHKDQILGHQFSVFTMNPETHAFFKNKILETGFIDDFEIVLKKMDGTLIYCLESAHSVKREDGTIIEIQGSIKDITERIKNERALWTMNFELLKVNQELKNAQNLIIQQEKLASLGQLSAGVAHEINNPLGFLKSNQTMLKNYFNTLLLVVEKMDSTDEKVKEACADADINYIAQESKHIFSESEEGFDRIRTIVTQLMTFSRTSAADVFEQFDVNEGIEATLSVARNELKYVAEVTKKFGDLPKISAKKGEINQVILNVLVNASHAIASQKKNGKGKIVIATRATEKNVIIKIANDGPIIPKDIQNKIFDPFFTTKEPGKGTGLGLSISYDIIVSKHNGTMTVVSEPGRGTCFTITLPILQKNRTDKNTLPETPSIESPQPQTGQNDGGTAKESR